MQDRLQRPFDSAAEVGPAAAALINSETQLFPDFKTSNYIVRKNGVGNTDLAERMASEILYDVDRILADWNSEGRGSSSLRKTAGSPLTTQQDQLLEAAAAANSNRKLQDREWLRGILESIRRVDRI